MNKKSLDAVLRRMMERLGVTTDSELARALPINRQTLASWRKRDSVPYLECIKFSEEHGVSLDWLLTGQGPMLRGDTSPSTTSEPENPREQALLALWRELGEDAQREIQGAAEEKKRLNDLERQLKELAAVVADIKRPA